MEMMVIKEKVDRYAELTKEQAAIKEEIEELKGFFETLATDELKDTKLKTTSYWGSNNTKVSVSNSETVKIVSNEMLRQLFGKIHSDFVTEKATYEMTAPCKRLLGMAFLGNYTEGNIDEVIHQITKDEKIQKTLKKKLKGNYEKDKAMLMSLAELSEQEANDWAYFAQEVINWEWLTQILVAANWNGTTQSAIDHIRASIMVDEGIKVAFEGEKKK